MVKWSRITKPKNKGGLGIKDLRRMNISLLCKWWWKAENGNDIWQEIIAKKYLKKGIIFQLKKSNKNSPVWNDLLKVRHIYLKDRSMMVGNGKMTSFWHDKWCGLVSLADNFPRLYAINNEQEASVANMKQNRWHLTFRRWLHEELQNQLRWLYDIVMRCDTNEERDKAKWD